jgi:tetratricopeptide (TPR) repeat protein
MGLAAELVLIVTLHAQQTEAVLKYRQALQYEQEGEWERALPLYESLYRADSNNVVYFDGLRRAYTQVKQYDKAKQLVAERLTRFPTDQQLQSFLGSLYYLAGEEATADSLWNVVIRSDPRNIGLYRMVASHMIENRLYDRAIQMFLKARTETGNKHVFAEELSWLYSSFQQYALAAKELIAMLRSNPAQLASIQSRFAALISRESGLNEALAVVREEVKKSEHEVVLRMLLAWLYMEQKNYEAALAEYRSIDVQRNAGGQELFTFAQRALQEKAYRAAAAAFRQVVKEYPSNERLPFARYGLARAIEELSAEQDTSDEAVLPAAALNNVGQISETQPSFQSALALYSALVREYPGTEFAAQAYVRVGLIRRHRFFDIDGALDAFEQARRITQSPSIIFEATFNIGEALTIKNDLTGARAEYQRLIQSSVAEVHDRGVFKLAELDYFEAKFDSALTKIRMLATDIAADLANDALQLQYFIQENKTTAPAALANFAKADLLVRQSKYSEALQQFKEIIRQYPTALCVDDAVMRTGELYLKLKQIDEALAAFRTVAQEMPTSIYRDYAQMRIAELYERVVRNPMKAIEAYELVLSKFPHSLYAEEARKRIRLLRGDVL